MAHTENFIPEKYARSFGRDFVLYCSLGFNVGLIIGLLML